jgi:hypothetical protein
MWIERKTMSNSVPETSFGADILRYLRYQLRGRRGLVATGFGIGAAALWFGWPLLAAAGLAPILIALAPCAIMCVVGVCTMKACSTGSAPKADPTAIPHTPDEMIEPFDANDVAEGIAGPVPAKTADTPTEGTPS